MNHDIVLIIGVLFLAILSVYFRALTGSGAVAAVVVGVSISIGTGLRGLLLLGLFFATSTLWSKFRKQEKTELHDMVEKGDVRDYAQVLANGGIPALFSLIYAFVGSPPALFAFATSLASANADTWASEIGVLAKKDPVLPFSGKSVPKGTSGAISVLGTVAGLFGSFVIAFISFFLWMDVFHLTHLFAICAWGFFSMFFDSLLGHILQEKRKCQRCGRMTEKTKHCGFDTIYNKGIPGFNNDWVNITAIGITSILSYFFYPGG